MSGLIPAQQGARRRSYPRGHPVFVIYVIAKHRDVFESTGGLRVIRDDARILVWRFTERAFEYQYKECSIRSALRNSRQYSQGQA